MQVMKNRKIILTVLFICILSHVNSFACTSMLYQDALKRSWVIKSFDFSNPNGHLFVNKRNVSKKAVITKILRSVGPLRWKSRFGSVTFSQIGRNFPFGGMNEKGLNVEILWLDDTEYPQTITKNYINETQLIQYLLDMAKDVDEAIELIQKISISPIVAPVHYMICDKSSKCKVVEFLDHQIKISHMSKKREKILQNSVYEEELFQMRNYSDTVRLERDVYKSLFKIESLKKENEILERIFFDLDKIRQFEEDSTTIWQIVYNLEDLKIWFRTKDYRTVKMINLNELDFSCTKNPSEQVLNMNNDYQGNMIALLFPFTDEVNDFLVDSFTQVELPRFYKWIMKKQEKLYNKCDN